MVNIKDVAKSADVSIATVSRYFNAPDLLNDNTRIRIEKAIRELNYVPNRVAVSMRTSRTNTIAIIVPSFENLIYVDMYREFRKASDAMGYTIDLFTTDGIADNLRKSLREVVSRRFDGVIICYLDEVDLKDDIEATARQLPLVLLSSNPNPANTSLVYVDALDGLSKATQHLIDIGRQRIACVAGPKDKVITSEKLRGFQITMERNGFTIPEDYVMFGPNHFHTGFYAARQFLTLKEPPDGIVCGTDDIAIGCLKSLISSRIRVPEDMALIGFNGISLLNTYEPSISTVAQQMDQIARETVRMLVHIINHPKARRQHTSFKASLLVGKSTDSQAPNRFTF